MLRLGRRVKMALLFMASCVCSASDPRPRVGDPFYKPRAKRTGDQIKFLRDNVEDLSIQILCLHCRNTTVMTNEKQFEKKLPYVESDFSQGGIQSTEKPQRAIIIGDIHGCAKELEELLEKVSFVHGKDLLVLTGDIVAKGAESQKALQLAMSLNAVFVRGNHDWEVLRRRNKASPKIEIDETENANTHDRLAKCLSEAEVEYLASGPHMLYIPQYDVLVVHAAVSFPDIANTNAYDAMHARNVWSDDQSEDFLESQKGPESVRKWGYSCPKVCPACGSAYFAENGAKGLPQWISGIDSCFSATDNLTEDISKGTPWADSYPSGGLPFVVFGHDARRGLQLCSNACGIDTGCAYGKKLTALILPEKEVVSVGKAE